MKEEAKENLIKAFNNAWNEFTNTYTNYEGSTHEIARHFFFEGAVEALTEIEKKIKE